MTVYPDSLKKLIDQFAKLPGIGKKTAERLSIYILNSKKEVVADFSKEKRIFVSRNDFPNLDEGCFYFNDFIGSKIIDKENNIFGRVVDIMMFPANEVLLVEYKNKEIMIPVVDDFVELFDFENNIIKVKNIKSLIEL